MRFLSNFGCKIILMCSVNFWHQQDSNSLFKGSIGHVTSKCKWPIACNKLSSIKWMCLDLFLEKAPSGPTLENDYLP